MEEIEVGKYVRTIYHNIEKIEKIYKEDTYFIIETDQNVYESTWFKNNILKHSKNIIDLIEVGDYVNGRKVKHIRDYEDFKRLDFDDDMDNTIYAEQICSIVTKEQFASMEYKIQN